MTIIEPQKIDTMPDAVLQWPAPPWAVNGGRLEQDMITYEIVASDEPRDEDGGPIGVSLSQADVVEYVDGNVVIARRTPTVVVDNVMLEVPEARKLVSALQELLSRLDGAR